MEQDFFINIFKGTNFINPIYAYQETSKFFSNLYFINVKLFCLGGFGIIPAIISYYLASKSEGIYKMNPDAYSNFGKIKKGKIIAVIGIVLNIIVIGITIWTLSTIGWDAWSDEFVRKWNEGMQNGRG